jgi:ribosome-binding protein aMBF1 (putative translation factor)
LGESSSVGYCTTAIRIKYARNQEKRKQAKLLPGSIKTIGGLIQVKRMEKNLMPGHVAAKMGIATALVRSWENGASQPDNRQVEVLANLLGFDARTPFHVIFFMT